jgi:hypothetical protein
MLMGASSDGGQGRRPDVEGSVFGSGTGSLGPLVEDAMPSMLPGSWPLLCRLSTTRLFFDWADFFAELLDAKAAGQICLRYFGPRSSLFPSLVTPLHIDQNNLIISGGVAALRCCVHLAGSRSLAWTDQQRYDRTLFLLNCTSKWMAYLLKDCGDSDQYTTWVWSVKRTLHQVVVQTGWAQRGMAPPEAIMHSATGASKTMRYGMAQTPGQSASQGFQAIEEPALLRALLPGDIVDRSQRLESLAPWLFEVSRLIFRMKVACPLSRMASLPDFDTVWAQLLAAFTSRCLLRAQYATDKGGWTIQEGSSSVGTPSQSPPSSTGMASRSDVITSGITPFRMGGVPWIPVCRSAVQYLLQTWAVVLQVTGLLISTESGSQVLRSTIRPLLTWIVDHFAPLPPLSGKDNAEWQRQTRPGWSGDELQGIGGDDDDDVGSEAAWTNESLAEDLGELVGSFPSLQYIHLPKPPEKPLVVDAEDTPEGVPEASAMAFFHLAAAADLVSSRLSALVVCLREHWRDLSMDASSDGEPLHRARAVLTQCGLEREFVDCLAPALCLRQLIRRSIPTRHIMRRITWLVAFATETSASALKSDGSAPAVSLGNFGDDDYDDVMHSLGALPVPKAAAARGSEVSDRRVEEVLARLATFFVSETDSLSEALFPMHRLAHDLRVCVAVESPETASDQIRRLLFDRVSAGRGDSPGGAGIKRPSSITAVEHPDAPVRTSSFSPSAFGSPSDIYSNFNKSVRTHRNPLSALLQKRLQEERIEMRKGVHMDGSASMPEITRVDSAVPFSPPPHLTVQDTGSSGGSVASDGTSCYSGSWDDSSVSPDDQARMRSGYSPTAVSTLAQANRQRPNRRTLFAYFLRQIYAATSVDSFGRFDTMSSDSETAGGEDDEEDEMQLWPPSQWKYPSVAVAKMAACILNVVLFLHQPRLPRVVGPLPSALTVSTEGMAVANTEEQSLLDEIEAVGDKLRRKLDITGDALEIAEQSSKKQQWAPSTFQLSAVHPESGIWTAPASACISNSAALFCVWTVPRVQMELAVVGFISRFQAWYATSRGEAEAILSLRAISREMAALRQAAAKTSPAYVDLRSPVSRTDATEAGQELVPINAVNDGADGDEMLLDINGEPVRLDEGDSDAGSDGRAIGDSNFLLLLMAHLGDEHPVEVLDATIAKLLDNLLLMKSTPLLLLQETLRCLKSLACGVTWVVNRAAISPMHILDSLSIGDDLLKTVTIRAVLRKPQGLQFPALQGSGTKFRKTLYSIITRLLFLHARSIVAPERSLAKRAAAVQSDEKTRNEKLHQARKDGDFTYFAGNIDAVQDSQAKDAYIFESGLTGWFTEFVKQLSHVAVAIGRGLQMGETFAPEPRLSVLGSARADAAGLVFVRRDAFHSVASDYSPDSLPPTSPETLFQAKAYVIGWIRDLHGILLAACNHGELRLIHDWFIQIGAHRIFQRIAREFRGDNDVILPLLRLQSEYGDPTSHRLFFPPGSVGGILVFRCIASVINVVLPNLVMRLQSPQEWQKQTNGYHTSWNAETLLKALMVALDCGQDLLMARYANTGAMSAEGDRCPSDVRSNVLNGIVCLPTDAIQSSLRVAFLFQRVLRAIFVNEVGICSEDARGVIAFSDVNPQTVSSELVTRLLRSRSSRILDTSRPPLISNTGNVFSFPVAAVQSIVSSSPSLFSGLIDRCICCLDACGAVNDTTGISTEQQEMILETRRLTLSHLALIARFEYLSRKLVIAAANAGVTPDMDLTPWGSPRFHKVAPALHMTLSCAFRMVELLNAQGELPCAPSLLRTAGRLQSCPIDFDLPETLLPPSQYPRTLLGYPFLLYLIFDAERCPSGSALHPLYTRIIAWHVGMGRVSETALDVYAMSLSLWTRGLPFPAICHSQASRPLFRDVDDPASLITVSNTVKRLREFIHDALNGPK